VKRRMCKGKEVGRSSKCEGIVHISVDQSSVFLTLFINNINIAINRLKLHMKWIKSDSH